MKKWQVIDEFIKIKNRWIEFYGENCIDEENNKLEYYRVKRADSIIIIPIINDKLLLPKKYYRHGINEITLDFPGGRWEKGVLFVDCVENIIRKELLLENRYIKKIERLNENGWYSDSSFSSQKVFGAVVYIDAPDKNFSESVDVNGNSIGSILKELDCMQCRTVFNEWIRKGSSK